jgi:hypothetical protein
VEQIQGPAASLFGVANTIALISWLFLASTLFVPSVRRWGWRITGIIVPALFAVAYILALVAGLQSGASGGFDSLEQVRLLFSNDFALLGGWIHYLAFDLFVGTWIARNGVNTTTPRLLLVVCLVLTFMVGPVGLLAYVLLRAVPGSRSWESLS